MASVGEFVTTCAGWPEVQIPDAAAAQEQVPLEQRKRERAPPEHPPGRHKRSTHALCCLTRLQRMEPLWSPVVAPGGNRSQIQWPREPQKKVKTVAVGCDRLPRGAHGKEGVAAQAVRRSGGLSAFRTS